jgi:hypothetical protein
MNEPTTPLTKQFSGSASLAALGIKLKELKLFEPIEQTVQIAQKTVKDRPSDKLYDAFISLLAGAYGLVEINTRLRADAFGQVVQLVLNQAAPLAPALVDPLCELLARSSVAVNLGQT